MPWVEVAEPFARPAKPAPVGERAAWTGPVAIDRGLAELIDVAVDGADLDLDDCVELSLVDSSLVALSVEPGLALTIEARRSVIERSDLGQARLSSVRASTFDGCKLSGTDLSSATVADTVFTNCVLRFTNLRMASLQRVRFVDCVLDDVDCYELRAEDVEFERCTLRSVNVDRLQADRVDLRGATELLLTGVGRLTGCLVAEHQLPSLAYSLALAADLGIERPAEHVED